MRGRGGKRGEGSGWGREGSGQGRGWWRDGEWRRRCKREVSEGRGVEREGSLSDAVMPCHVQESGGIMTLADVYCRYNRARGLDVSGPEQREQRPCLLCGRAQQSPLCPWHPAILLPYPCVAVCLCPVGVP